MNSAKTLIIAAMLLALPFMAHAHQSKMAIQVSSSDPTSQKLALNNARNLKRTLGNENVDVEIVVYGPGIGLIKADGKHAGKIAKMQSEQGIKFSVCSGTLKAYAKRNDGKMPDIIDGVSKVRTGALRILQLQEAGYAYMRP